ncbi:unnamed protein product [Ostreobium quekettii]|uniref:RRM domain-containing protein n=1 Tax=Ostreobium quekettii TaxID=121088 RepID=A0A8S1JD52_9CHLO|nr:unnamed protein product [Ostreobium quekettii]|eukprot:evm.model.scf_826.4 EVM.evm.TU.scf_826.4   scf_826:59024-61516(-)
MGTNGQPVGGDSMDEDLEVDKSSGEEEDSSSEDGQEISDKDIDEIMALEAALKENPNAYDTHVKYINKLKECKLRPKARAARHAMQKLFPLTEALWVEWLADEIEEANSMQDAESITKLFELAVEDYLSVDMWKQFLDFLVNAHPQIAQMAPEGVTLFRATADRALAACGLHLGRGWEIWDAVLQYEQCHERSMKDGKEREAQRDRIRSLFHRVLAVPLLTGRTQKPGVPRGTERKHMEAYEQWEKDVGGREVPARVYRSLEKAQMMVDIRRSFEERVGENQTADAELLASYLAYIKIEETNGDPARVQCIYERALAVFPVTHSLWLSYGAYLDKHIKTGPVLKSVYLRAVRNCPWVGELWGQSLRTLERMGTSDEEFDGLYQQALQTGLQGVEDYLTVILTRIDRARRLCAGNMDKLRQVFSDAAQLLGQYFPQWVDRDLRLVAYWADCELTIGGDVERAREVYEMALKTCAGGVIELWKSYVMMELGNGNIAEARRLYQRGHSKIVEQDARARFCLDWLRFERERGSAEEYCHVHQKVAPIIEAATAAQYSMHNQQQAEISENALQKTPKLTKKEKNQLKREGQPPGEWTRDHQAAKKRKVEHKKDDSSLMPPPPPRKPQGTKQSENGAAAAMAKGALCPESNHNPMEKPVSDMHHEASKHAAPLYSDNLTVYVRGITLDTEDSQLEELFKPCGGLKEVRHMRNPSGTSRGYAYVEFESKEGADKAVELGGTMLNGRALFVAMSKPTKGPNAVRGGFRGGGPGRGDHDMSRGRARGRGRVGGRFSSHDGRGRGRGHGRGWLQGGGQEQESVDDGKPKTNEELRKMLLG